MRAWLAAAVALVLALAAPVWAEGDGAGGNANGNAGREVITGRIETSPDGTITLVLGGDTTPANRRSRRDDDGVMSIGDALRWYHQERPTVRGSLGEIDDAMTTYRDEMREALHTAVRATNAHFVHLRDAVVHCDFAWFLGASVAVSADLEILERALASLGEAEAQFDRVIELLNDRIRALIRQLNPDGQSNNALNSGLGLIPYLGDLYSMLNIPGNVEQDLSLDELAELERRITQLESQREELGELKAYAQRALDAYVQGRETKRAEMRAALARNSCSASCTQGDHHDAPGEIEPNDANPPAADASIAESTGRPIGQLLSRLEGAVRTGQLR